MRKAKATLPPAAPGTPLGWTPQDDSEHFIECPTCGHMIDCRDLGEVFQHEGPHEAPTKN